MSIVPSTGAKNPLGFARLEGEKKMSKICNRAFQERIGAIYIAGQLIIWAKGKKPSPCYDVVIERAPIRIYPPHYQIMACVEEGVFCPHMLVDYRAVAAFSVTRRTLEDMGGHAVVYHAEGTAEVPITVIALPDYQEAEQARDGSGVPSPFSLADGDVPFPFLLAKVFETGNDEDIELLTSADVESGRIGIHTATGYSNTFSFTEAFQDAVDNLPPDENPYPDKLTTVRVTGVGAQFGGLAGYNRMYVSVFSIY
jgi:hypothetical protein